MNIAAVHSASPVALESFEQLQKQVPLTAVEDADVVVVLGGDGMMLHSFHEYLHLNKPLYGMNRGTVGFLLNHFEITGLEERIGAAQKATLHPLAMTATQADGKVIRALAFNEVSLIRYSHQTANIQVVINDVERIDKLMSDGILVATAAGSTAYNLSARGPIIPIGANVLALTPVSPFRPRRWTGALVPHTSRIRFVNLDPEKRPLIASADFHEAHEVTSVEIREDRNQSVTVLFDPGQSLEERILGEQFTI
jgi:NAD+ kinase